MYTTDMDGAWRLYCPEALLPAKAIPRAREYQRAYRAKVQGQG